MIKAVFLLLQFLLISQGFLVECPRDPLLLCCKKTGEKDDKIWKNTLPTPRGEVSYLPKENPWEHFGKDSEKRLKKF